MDEKCICCGAVIPEGRQVCPMCEELLGFYKEGRLCLVPKEGYLAADEELRQLRAKERPQKPIISGVYACPRCKAILLYETIGQKDNRCKYCGQSLDWS